MASKHFFLKSTPFPTTLLLTSRIYSRLFFSALPPKPTSNLSPCPLKSSGFSFTPHAIIPSSVELEDPEVETLGSGRLRLLNEKLKRLGIDSGHCNPGQYYDFSCPMVREHARKLVEKHVKKPFFDVRCENECLPNIDWVLGLAKAAVLRHGVNGVVIDPYNKLDHQRPANITSRELKGLAKTF